MMRPLMLSSLRPVLPAVARIHRNGLCRGVGSVALAALLGAGAGQAQVLTIDTSGKNQPIADGPVQRQYQQIEPTHVQLPKSPLDARTRLLIVRVMQAEQGFAMRPFPRGHKGLTLAANGDLSPAGVPYLNMVIGNGLSAKPGARLVITNVRVDRDRIVFDLNGGPDAKHRFLRHIQIGMDPDMTNSVVADDGTGPAGSRLTLTFKDHVPDLTGDQVKALLAPLISFDAKTPVQAFTDTLPKPLKDAILDHQVWVGMSTDMVYFAKGLPDQKVREMDGQMPVEIWIYGKPPDTVDFVRINGNRVIRVEIAPVGQRMQVYTKDVVTPMLEGTPAAVEAENANVRIIREGDVQRDPNKQAPAAPPTLGAPDDKEPVKNTSVGVMKPVHFPTQQPNSGPGANPDDQQPGASQPASAPPPAGTSPGAAPQGTPGSSGQAAPSAGSSQATPSGAN